MNGQSIPVTESGGFAEPFLLNRGYNRITLSAHDRYGKATERIIEIVYTPDPRRASMPTATSSSTVAP
jgi:hypothetical protein